MYFRHEEYNEAVLPVYSAKACRCHTVTNTWIHFKVHIKLLIFQNKNQIKSNVYCLQCMHSSESPNVKVCICFPEIAHWQIPLFYKLCEKYPTLMSRFRKTKSYFTWELFFFFFFFASAWSFCQYLFKARWTESLTLFRILVTLSQFKATLLTGPVATAAPCLPASGASLAALASSALCLASIWKWRI